MAMKAEMWDEILGLKGTGSAREVGERLDIPLHTINSIWNGERRRPGWIQDRTRARKLAEQKANEESSWTPNEPGNGNGQGSRCGLTTVERVDLFHSQGDVCYLCEEFVNFDLTHVDHDHSHQECAGKGCRSCVRGLACRACNTTIGYYNDDPKLMRLRADNLEAAIKRTKGKWNSMSM